MEKPPEKNRPHSDSQEGNEKISLRILVVEGNVTTLETTVRLLRLRYSKVAGVADLQEAFRRLASFGNNYDCAVVGAGKYYEGLALLRQICDIDGMEDFPVVVISGNPEFDEQTTRELGAEFISRIEDGSTDKMLSALDRIAEKKNK